MKQICKRFLPAALILMLVVSLTAGAVSAREILDPSRTGSMTMKLYDSEKSEAVVGAEISITQVAEAKFDENGNEVFAYTSAFSKAVKPLDDLNAAGLASYFVDFAQKNKIPVSASAVTDSKGDVTFRDLPLGLYLVQMTKQDSKYHTMTAYLVTIPMTNEDGTKNYDVNATPKLQVSRETIDIKVVKVWANDKPEYRPASLTVDLLGNSQIAETVELNKENDWSFVFHDMPKDVTWSVQERVVPKDYKVSYSADQATYTFTITNTYAPPPPLIQTGQLNWPVPVLFCSGMLFIAVGWMICHVRKSKEES